MLGLSLAFSPLLNEAAIAQQNIGGTVIVVNDVRGVIGKQEPAVLRAGIDVFQDEIIRTADRSASRVRFQDGTELSIGSTSEVTLDRFVFDPNPEKSQVALSIARGVVRFTTGSLPKSSYKISTPTATIGVRGTILTITVAEDGATTVSVDDGVALVSSGGQTVEVDSGKSTTANSATPPVPPVVTPPTPPPVGEMDYLLAQNNELAPGPPAGHALAGVVTGIVPVGIAGIILGLILTSGHSHQSTSTSGTH